jgi:tetratricopeptide (TPR) repeat protein
MTELNPQDIQLIERYLDGQLEGNENTIFTQRMAMDTDFKRAVESYEEAVLAVKLAGEDGITAVLKQEQAKLGGAQVVPINAKTPKTFSILRGSLVAAGIAALLFVGYWILDKPKTLSPLVAAYFQPYPALGITRGDETQDIATEALRTYAVNDYKNAIPLLGQSFQLKKDSLLLFYKSIAYLGIGQAAQAQPILTALQGSESVPTESVEWYLALVYIELGDKEKAIPLLQKLSNVLARNVATEGGHVKEAIEILEKIKNKK